MLFLKSQDLFETFLRVTQAYEVYRYVFITVLNTFNHNKCAHILAYILHAKIKGAVVAVIVW